MPPELTIRINGVMTTAIRGQRLAATLCNAGILYTRIARDGSLRAPFCGMGICMECRVRVDGEIVLACLTRVADGMDIHTDA